jgi:murein DD-endopeptidase MepM/ murein hydrolase activator NlpD
MSGVVEQLRSRLKPSASVLALLIGVAGCSGETTRFNENPYAQSNADATGSIQQTQPGATARVDSRPLPQPGQQALPPGVGTAGGGRGMASYTPPPSAVNTRPAAPDVTGSVAPKPAPSGHWTWDGGTPMTVAQGDTIDTISRRYGVPASAIAQANNLPPASALHPGQHLVIPRYINSASATSQAPLASPPATRAAAAASKATTTAAPAPGTPGVHVVAAGETLSKISRLYGKPVAEIAKANNMQPATPLKIGDRLVIPGVRVTAKKPGTAVAQPKETVSEPTHSVSLVSPTTEVAQPKEKTAEAAGGLPTFRWPAQGRVIAGFGSSANGSQNDGINIALPEGTPVKAAEDGVVAYAGNELKGYGNLVLVRHSNGYVTAYAHAKEVMVKRGDQVKRGQVILKSGQTGNVNAPQLHFEVRKGATPIDPMRFLKGA